MTARRWVQNAPTFPKPLKPIPGFSRWKLEDIENWQTARAAATARLISFQDIRHPDRAAAAEVIPNGARKTF